ncbi:E3 ubiquitin ligase PQT3-like isoform X2 [Phoenix dactylifera]|uniref:E3 ubiquitin ligase PQT3-like isoform X2 n=1 Tax=Phoenix dactylifera TaxID=42345 RepID=A0A8B7CEF1_PHODC|nr:E3 ubiquitin ligase PQT3-like isoform X2 [Phoenix dactylifera]
MAVYYKFKSAKDYDSVPIEGQFISVANLKERIFESKHLGRGTDFDLMVSNAQTNEEYVDEGAMIPKNTSVLIRRVPGRPRKPIVTERDEMKVVEDKVEDLPPASSTLLGDSSTMKYPEESEWDEFGNDLYAIPEALPALSTHPVVDVSPANKVDEDSKIKALIDTPALDWNRQTQEGYGAGRGFGRGVGGRMIAGRGFGRGGLERKTPPAGYVCHRCKVPGHFIQHCPTNGDPNYDIKRMKPPTGIPRSMLVTTPDGSYALPGGSVAVLKPNEAAFEKEIEGLPTTRPVSDLPPELHCPLCKEVMKDAVLTGKCCFRSFCDKCIRDYIISKSMCVCGATDILADDLLPNKTLRETISRILESATSSTDNAGSLVHIQDMESAREVQPKIPSPTLSAASKGEPKQVPPTEPSPNVKEGEAASNVKGAHGETNSSDKKVTVNVNKSEAIPESENAKVTLPESSPVPEETQEKLLAGDQGKKKKKKKTRLAGNASDMQWRPYQDFGAENFVGVPLAPSGYNPYWAGGGMPLGVDGYMASFTGPMQYMGYTPGPFDVPFGGGILPQDPFAAQGYMMPAVPRDMSEFGIGGMNQGPGYLTREEFEAKKAELRRKRGLDRLHERERELRREEREPRREPSRTNDVSSLKSKPRLTSRAASLDRSDREDRSEKGDRRGISRDSGRHSPSRTGKRRASDLDEPPQAESAKPERKQKGSVFSRISFPESSSGGGEGASKKRKSSEVPLKNGLKDQHEPAAHHRSSSDGHRVEWKGSKGGGSSSMGSRRYEHVSSDEEYHFKRKPSSSRREAEEEGRPARGSRERETHERGSKRR